MTLKCHTKFEKKLTCGLENDMRNLVKFHQSTRKSQNWVTTMKNDEKELTWCFEIDMRDLTNFDPNTKKFQKFAL